MNNISTQLNKILILNMIPNTIGDSLFITPLFKIIKKNYFNSYLVVTATSTNIELFKNNPNINEIINIPELCRIGDNNLSKFMKFFLYLKIILGLIFKLKKYDFDLIIITQPNLPILQIIPFIVGVPYSVGYKYKGSIFSRFLSVAVDFYSPKDYPNRHYLESNIDLLRSLNLKFNESDKRCLKVVTRDELIIASGILERYDVKNKFICFQAGAKWKRKQWPLLNFKKLASLLTENNYSVILLGNKDEYEMNQLIKDNNKKIINLSGKCSLSECAAILKKSVLYVGNDSGLAHLASAVGTNTVVIYGTTNPLHSVPVGYARTISVFSRHTKPKLYLDDNPDCERLMSRISVNQVFKIIIKENLIKL